MIELISFILVILLLMLFVTVFGDPPDDNLT